MRVVMQRTKWPLRSMLALLMIKREPDRGRSAENGGGRPATGRCYKNSHGEHADRNPNSGQDKEPQRSGCHIYAATGRQDDFVGYRGDGTHEACCLSGRKKHRRWIQQNRKLKDDKCARGIQKMKPCGKNPKVVMCGKVQDETDEVAF